VAAVVLIGSCTPASPPVVLATTTSVAQSGLLERLLPAYDAHGRSPVRVLQVGSGRALAFLTDGTADVVISHAPEREADALSQHPGWYYRKVLHNRFLIVGPPDDPAGLTGVRDAVSAMERLAESGERFVSRGDESGTHERERQLWTLARASPPPGQLVVAGTGMGQTLRIADEMRAYTLTDEATFQALSRALQLRALVAGDARLVNTYAVLADPLNDAGLRFARWLAEGDGRTALGDVLARRELTGFSMWPAGAAADRPGASPGGTMTNAR
jgi:tungstate transport system substrate-binding protein